MTEDPSTGPPAEQSKKKKSLIALGLGTVAVCVLVAGILNMPLPERETTNQVHTWPVPKQSAIDLLRSDWFKEAGEKPAAVAPDPGSIERRLLGCWKYRNGRLGNFEGSLVIRSFDGERVFKGFWNYDRGKALPLIGEYRVLSGDKPQILVDLKNSSGARYGQNLLLRGDDQGTHSWLCKAESDPFAGNDFRAVKTSQSLRPAVTSLSEPILPRTLSLLSGRWHAVEGQADQFDIEEIFDDGTFAIKRPASNSSDMARRQADGGFIGDGQEINIFFADEAYLQLQAAQSGAQITLNDGDEKPVLVRDPAPADSKRAGGRKAGSMWSGIMSLIQQHDAP
ncbi:MAG: hypothetical protein JSS86_14120 [Cyanobacteria bacterium SZAS LIN-2]|nr:hypothetical protein [Cyanobacteria bacterium SZAS LIN-2]